MCFPLACLRELKRERITAVLPTRETAATIGSIVERLQELDGFVDQILVVDAASEDGTAELAARAGAEVHQESELMPEFGQALGKGDAMWRALSVARGELVVYLDADTSDFSPHFATGMLGPLICREDVQFVKGFFHRPFVEREVERPLEGGRVTELTARPLLSAFYPELAGFVQPLAGEVAARRSSFATRPRGGKQGTWSAAPSTAARRSSTSRPSSGRSPGSAAPPRRSPASTSPRRPPTRAEACTAGRAATRPGSRCVASARAGSYALAPGREPGAAMAGARAGARLGAGRAVEDVGEGAGEAVESTGEAVEDVGAGAGSAVEDVGEGAGEAVESTGEAVEDVGAGAGSAVEDVGESDRGAVKDVGEAAGEGVKANGETLKKAGQGAGKAVGGAGKIAKKTSRTAQQGQNGVLRSSGAGRRPRAPSSRAAGRAARSRTPSAGRRSPEQLEMSSKKRRSRPHSPDIEFTASLQADELRFDEPPETEVRFFGDPGHESESGSDRTNLPEKVDPGVTYRDVRIDYRLANRLIEPAHRPGQRGRPPQRNK